MKKLDKQKPKLYVIRKYVMASSVVDAARREKITPVHEIFVDEKWQEKHLADAIGFTVASDDV
jgi:hypothetical protein